jgi:DNA-binding NtrC family response regulator
MASNRREELMDRQPLAIVVEDDDNQRALLSTLLEESEMEVLECDSAEAAISVLDRIGESVCFLFTDVKLAGRMSGAALAAKAKDRYPHIDVVVTSSSLPPELPGDAKFMPKPWQPLDVLREVQRTISTH